MKDDNYNKPKDQPQTNEKDRKEYPDKEETSITGEDMEPLVDEDEGNENTQVLESGLGIDE